MADFFSRVAEEARALVAAPIVTTAAFVGSVLAIWLAFHWLYATNIRNRDVHIASLERRVAEYRDRLNGASPEEARRRLDTLEAEVATLRLRLQPRRLSPAQRQAIIDRSRLPAGATARSLTVIAAQGCSDCADFAEELVAALRAAEGWVVGTPQPAQLAEKSRVGLVIRVAEPLRPPPEAVILQQALRSAGLPFETLSKASGSDIELLVVERAV